MTPRPAHPHPTPMPKIQPAAPPSALRVGSSPTRGDGPARSVAVLGAGRKIVVAGSCDARIAAVAAQQRNRANRRQLLAAGVSSREIERRIRTDRLFPQLPGVYAVGSPAHVHLGRETSALLAVREGALLSHLSAAHLWGLLDGLEDDGPIDVVVGDHWIPRVAGLRGHRSRILTPADRRLHERLPVCSPARVLLDLAVELSATVLQRAFDEAVIARRVTAAEVGALLERAGRHPGVPVLRELVADAEAGITESEAERLLQALLAQTDLPRPSRGRRVAGYRLDCLWPQAGLCVEVDGFRFHSTRRRFESDRVRDARLAALGIEVMRVTWRQLESEPLAVIARIAAAYARRVEAKR